MSTLTRDEALALIRRKGMLRQPLLLGLFVVNLGLQFGVNLPRAIRQGDTLLLWMFAGSGLLLAALLVLIAPSVWRQWRASRHPGGVEPLTVLDGPLSQRPVRDGEGRDWEIEWGGNVARPGTTVWTTPLEESRPYFVVVPAVSADVDAAQVIYSVRGPKALDG